MIIGIPHKLQNDDAGASGSGLNLVELNDDGSPKEGAGGGAETIETDPDAGGGADEDRGDTVVVDDTTTGTTPAVDDPGTPGNRIPQSRLNEVIAQRDADREARRLEKERADRLEAELAELRAGKTTTPAPGPAATPAAPAAPAQPEFDERKAEKEYAELLADGEFEKAADLRMQINDQIRQQAAIEVEARQAERTTTQTTQTVAAQAVVDFPYLDTTEGVTAMTAIMAERNRLYSQGTPLAEALQLAVDKIAPALAPAGFVAPERGTPGKGSTAPNGRADNRPARAAARGAATDAGQPPALRGGQGNAPTGTVDVESMSESQFEALTPAERARLRGD